MLERLRLRLRRWLIGYDLQVMGIEMQVTGYGEVIKELKEVESHLDRILEKGEKAEAILKRLGRLKQ